MAEKFYRHCRNNVVGNATRTIKSKLTQRLLRETISGAARSQETHVLQDTEVPGLWARITPRGTASWGVSYRVRPLPGQPRAPRRQKHLGTAHDLSGDEARETARAVLRIARDHRDPNDEEMDAKQQAAAERARLAMRQRFSVTIEEALEKVIQSRPPHKKWSRQHEADMRLGLHRALAVIGDKPTADITGPDIAGARDHIAATHGAGPARKMMYACNHVFGHAKEKGLVQGNPCSDLKRPELYQPREIYPTLAEVQALRAAARRLYSGGKRRRHPSPGYLAYEMAMVSGIRRDEAMGLRWGSVLDEGAVLKERGTSESVRLSYRVFRLPRPKNRSAFLVPISEAMAEILAIARAACDGTPAPQDLLFPAVGRNGRPVPASGHSKMWPFVLAGANLAPEPDDDDGDAGEGDAGEGEDEDRIILHDFRRAMVNILGNLRNAHGVKLYDEGLLDMLLNHRKSASRPGVLRVYHMIERLDERRAALDHWSLMTTVPPESDHHSGSKVVPLRRRA